MARKFSGTEDLLSALQRRTALLAAAVLVVAGAAGWWLARRITGRLVRLTAVAESVAEHGRLDVPVPVAGRDEVARLGRAFDDMLGRLAAAVQDQQRLVQDAGHELRTPLTSLRTNISLLKRFEELPPRARAELLTDLAGEARELTDLVNELVDLAAGQRGDDPLAEVSLADVAEKGAASARRRTGREITVRSTRPAGGRGPLPRRCTARSPTCWRTPPSSIPGGTQPIEVVVTGARVEVLDRGPGIADTDRTRVFDRFYRAPPPRGGCRAPASASPSSARSPPRTAATPSPAPGRAAVPSWASRSVRVRATGPSGPTEDGGVDRPGPSSRAANRRQAGGVPYRRVGVPKSAAGSGAPLPPTARRARRPPAPAGRGCTGGPSDIKRIITFLPSTVR